MRIVSILLIVVGAGLGLLSVSFIFSTNSELSARERLSGVVVESNRDLPDIEYGDTEGISRRVHMDSGSGNQFRLGQRIFFYVDASDNHWATPEGLFNLYPLQIIGGVFAVLFLLVGSLMMINQLALLGALLCGLLALSIGSTGFFFLKDSVALQLTGAPITGRIVAVTSTQSSEFSDRSGGHLGATTFKTIEKKIMTVEYTAPDGSAHSFKIRNPYTDAKKGDEVPLVVDLSQRIANEALRGWKDTVLLLLTVTVLAFGFAGGAVLFWLAFRAQRARSRS